MSSSSNLQLVSIAPRSTRIGPKDRKSWAGMVSILFVAGSIAVGFGEVNGSLQIFVKELFAMGHAEVMKIVSKYLKTQLSVMNFSTVKTCGGSIPLVSQHPIGSPLSAGNSGSPRLYCVIPYLSWEIVTSLYSTVKATTKNHVFFCRPHFFILTLPIDRTH